MLRYNVKGCHSSGKCQKCNGMRINCITYYKMSEWIRDYENLNERQWLIGWYKVEKKKRKKDWMRDVLT